MYDIDTRDPDLYNLKGSSKLADVLESYEDRLRLH